MMFWFSLNRSLILLCSLGTNVESSVFDQFCSKTKREEVEEEKEKKSRDKKEVILFRSMM